MMRTLSSSIKRKAKKRFRKSKPSHDTGQTPWTPSVPNQALVFDHGQCFDPQNARKEARPTQMGLDMLRATGNLQVVSNVLHDGSNLGAAPATVLTAEVAREKQRTEPAKEAPCSDDDYVFLILTHLPREILFRIFWFLQPMDLCNIGRTCTLFREVSEDDHLWRDLYYYSKEKHHLEHNPYKIRRRKWGQGELSWRKRYKFTFVVRQRKKKGKKIRHLLRGTDNEVFLNLESSVFDSQDSREPDQFITGEVTLNVRSEKVVTHGLYLQLYGEEAYRAYDAVRNVVRKMKRPVISLRVPILGEVPWQDRKCHTIVLHRGTYRYPLCVPFPKASILNKRLPPTFLRTVPKKNSYFRVEYHACAILSLPFPHSKVFSQKHALLVRNSERMNRKIRRRMAHIAATPAREGVSRRFSAKGGRRARFEAHLDKTFFNLDEETITITCNVDNRSSRSAVRYISVTLVEILGESQMCREIIKRGAGGVGQWRIVAAETRADESDQQPEQEDEPQDDGGEADDQETNANNEDEAENSLPAWRCRSNGEFSCLSRRHNLGDKRVYNVRVEMGEMVRGIELTYPVRWSDVLGESLFNTTTFHQTYLLVVTFHLAIGHSDPRVRIPIFLIKR